MCPCSQPLQPLNMASLHHKHCHTHTRVVLLLSWHNTVDDDHHQATCLRVGFNRIIISFLVCVLFFYLCVYVYISQLSQAPPFLLLSIYRPAIHLHSPCPTLPITSGHYTKQVTEGGRQRRRWGVVDSGTTLRCCTDFLPSRARPYLKAAGLGTRPLDDYCLLLNVVHRVAPWTCFLLSPVWAQPSSASSLACLLTPASCSHARAYPHTYIYPYPHTQRERWKKGWAYETWSGTPVYGVA